MPEKLAIDGGVPVRTEPFPARPKFTFQDAVELLEVLNQGTAFFPIGSKVYEFQRRFSQMYGVRYAVASTSGTAAIHVAIGAINPDPGSEIITTPVSDMGTVAPILLNNCIPVFADVELDTFNLDPADVEAKITDRTAAIIVVHCWGQPADMDAFVDIAQRHGLALIEDCSQAHLTRYKGRLVGTIGELGAFSLQDSKHLQCGDGGVTITDRAEYGERMELFVDKGCDWTEDRKYRLRYAFLAPCYRMTELQGAVLCAQLDTLANRVARRQRLGDMLTVMISGLDGVYPPKRYDDREHSYWSYPLRIDSQVLGVTPVRFAEMLQAEGIPAGGNWIGKPLYLFESLQEQITYGSSHCPFTCPWRGERVVAYAEGMCPNAERAFRELVTVHFHEGWTEREVEDTAEAIRKVAEACLRGDAK
ncbi:MAG: DegT/DnrJ/EryC1/StrS family aminotransferase [Armatimonadetes bacterium]|nr:DegT/DnrJ/EryC1/StrS family aminotransferase [Armatimonadota bacterium]